MVERASEKLAKATGRELLSASPVGGVADTRSLLARGDTEEDSNSLSSTPGTHITHVRGHAVNQQVSLCGYRYRYSCSIVRFLAGGC